MSFINLVLAVEEVDITGLENSINQDLGTNKFTDLASLFSKDLLNLVFVIVGLLFFASLVMAGWEYMMSSGDPKKVASATTRFTNSLLGLIMSFVAYLVVKIVLSFLGIGSLI